MSKLAMELMPMTHLQNMNIGPVVESHPVVS